MRIAEYGTIEHAFGSLTPKVTTSDVTPDAVEEIARLPFTLRVNHDPPTEPAAADADDPDGVRDVAASKYTISVGGIDGQHDGRKDYERHSSSNYGDVVCGHRYSGNTTAHCDRRDAADRARDSQIRPPTGDVDRESRAGSGSDGDVERRPRGS